MQSTTIFWFRRDLRLEDNAALYYALKENSNVLPIFIFDKNILRKLEDKTDARVSFIQNTIANIKATLQAQGSDLEVYYGEPIEVWQQILATYTIANVYTNRDYEGYAIHRDAAIEEMLQAKGIAFCTYKDHVIFEMGEVTKDDGFPYTVFTPYSRKWKAKLNTYYYKPYPTLQYSNHFCKKAASPMIELEEMGFTKSTIAIPSSQVQEEVVKHYSQQRDFPAIEGTTRIGIHLRFGTVSIRALASRAMQLNETYLNELIWRDFYHQITYHFPHINEGASFKKQYDAIRWRQDAEQFEKWCNGQTGYPIVDAGMRQLNATGYMHNRVRMIVASFLCKHLLLDWRLGEAYFAKKLLDFDFAANNGGWQWASSSGCDAAPYFRIFNPSLQTKKFDPNLAYIRKWVPEFEQLHYTKPIVEHELARERCLKTYAAALKPE